MLARTALALAQKVDALSATDVVQGANAMAPIATQLVAVMDRLRGLVRVPDKLDEIQARRDARRLVAAAGGAWQSVS